MRDVLIVAGICVLALVAGAIFFLNGGDVLPAAGGDGPVAYTVIAEGDTATHIDSRVNYRIKNNSELSELWFLIYGGSQPNMPSVDFDKHEVLAVFDGSHSTGGYDVAVRSIVDAGLTRSITIEHTEPGADCVVSQAITSPFVLVSVSKMPETHTLDREDVQIVKSCEGR